MKLRISMTMAALLTACSPGMMSAMGIQSTGGSLKATNTMSVPVCRVTVVDKDDANRKFVNELNHQVLIPAGGEASISYPPTFDDQGNPASAVFSLEVYGCTTEGVCNEAGTLLATIEGVDTSSQTAVALR